MDGGITSLMRGTGFEECVSAIDVFAWHDSSVCLHLLATTQSLFTNHQVSL